MPYRKLIDLTLKGMEKFTAVFLLAVGILYSDPGSDNLFYSLVLPGVLVASLLYLFWYKAFLALAGAALAYYFMDLESQSLIRGALMPILLGLCLVLFLIWSGMLNIIGGSGGGDFGGIDGGGDGGGE